MKLENSLRNAGLDAITALFNGKSIKLWTGALPANLTDPDPGTLLGTLTFGTPAFGASAAGTASVNAVTPDTSADATGTPQCYRIYNGATVIAQGSASMDSGGGELKVTPPAGQTQIIAGGQISVSTWTITLPAGT